MTKYFHKKKSTFLCIQFLHLFENMAVMSVSFWPSDSAWFHRFGNRFIEKTFGLYYERLPVIEFQLTLKHRERHGCVVSTMATDALVLKHQAISIYNAD